MRRCLSAICLFFERVHARDACNDFAPPTSPLVPRLRQSISPPATSRPIMPHEPLAPPAKVYLRLAAAARFAWAPSPIIATTAAIAIGRRWRATPPLAASFAAIRKMPGDAIAAAHWRGERRAAAESTISPAARQDEYAASTAGHGPAPLPSQCHAASTRCARAARLRARVEVSRRYDTIRAICFIRHVAAPR